MFDRKKAEAMKSIAVKEPVAVTISHSYKSAYCHIPTGRKVFIAQRFQGNIYYCHPNYSGDRAFTCEHDELEVWGYNHELFSHTVRLFAEPDITYCSLVAAVKFALKENGELLTEFKTI